ncbi:hypothetical protein Ssi02_77190 [Sinosporangium siamense]|uniref:Uncharacterized protein n=1 Tax=Sinosporangium siamense TaxID=1367973 RepID=A0A919VBK9_9ACTN|nr:hypothetical protein Ssi02_77190 [Sinosporangium siamense]
MLGQQHELIPVAKLLGRQLEQLLGGPYGTGQQPVARRRPKRGGELRPQIVEELAAPGLRAANAMS